MQGVNEDAIARLFRRFPGMEYCDLKKDRETGKSKVRKAPDVFCDVIVICTGLPETSCMGERVLINQQF